MTKKTERIEIQAKDLKSGDRVWDRAAKWPNTGYRIVSVGSLLGAVGPATGWDMFAEIEWVYYKGVERIYLKNDYPLIVERTIEEPPVEDRVVVRRSSRVEVEVDQAELCVIAEGETVYIYIADEMATLSRSEWDQIVGAL